MTHVLRVALDLLAEARRRRWFLALFGGISLVLLTLGLFLQVEVVDGMIAGSKLFGAVILKDMVSSNRAFGALYQVLTYFGFYGGLCFLGVACSDFAPELLSPGRIEHLLSLPVARWHLLFGTFVGVSALALASSVYGALGVTLLVGVKTGLWNTHLLQSALLGWVAFSTLYSVMLLANLVVRGAAVSGAAFAVTFLLGILASFQQSIAAAINPGVGRTLFVWLVAPFPRLGQVAILGAHLASGDTLPPYELSRLLSGCAVFAIAVLLLAVWRFEDKDF
jgi:ABC-type transport system involved in multi-copper enzyme maturation permease subunit